MDRLGLDWQQRFVMAIALSITSGCTASQTPFPTRTIEIQQAWQLQPGSTVSGHRVVAGLGDISILLNGGTIYAPFNGRVEPTLEDCVLFSSPDVPAYLFRFCGLSAPRLGDMPEGTAIGSGKHLHFAALRRQPDGTWTMVEPSQTILERILR
ncbi:MAG: hypothetical protein Kow00121_17010 [Elainellaceae cyanobacterium]